MPVHWPEVLALLVGIALLVGLMAFVVTAAIFLIRLFHRE